MHHEPAFKKLALKRRMPVVYTLMVYAQSMDWKLDQRMVAHSWRTCYVVMGHKCAQSPTVDS